MERGYASIVEGGIEELDAQYGPQGWRGMRRFAVHQAGGIRPCDNARASLHNACTGMHERLRCETADWPLRAAAVFAELLGMHDASWSMWLGTEDMEAAYRRVACLHPGYTVVAQWNPDAQRVEWIRIQGFNFGLKSAVIAYNRVAECITRGAVRLIPVCAAHYFARRRVQ